MKHSKLSPTAIVFSLVALLSLLASLSQPTLSLRTGYDYGTDENPSTADRYNDLKCTYLFAGITHLRLVKLILADRKVPTSMTVGLVAVNYNIRAVICTLYGVTHVKIGTLWLQLYYASIVQSYYQQYVLQGANEADRTAAVDRLETIHDYVTNRMQRELSTASCRPGNAFDSYEERLARQAASEPSGVIPWKGIQKEALDNCDELNKLLEGNNTEATYEGRYDSLRPRNLFLNNLGVNVQLKSKLMARYDVQVSWNNTSVTLENDFVSMHFMHSSALMLPSLFSIKKYYVDAFVLLKCIMYRLTWKFVLYVDKFTGERRDNYFKKWHALLVEFQKLLCLQDDPDVNGLLVAIHNHGSVEISNQLDAKLRSFNVRLQCVATNQMFLDPKKFPLSPDQGSFSQSALDRDSLKDAKAFIADLKVYFKDVDFDVIRSLLKYIEDED